MAEYLLVAETSAVTLTIAGVIKEIITIVVSSEELSPGIYHGGRQADMVFLKFSCLALFPVVQ